MSHRENEEVVRDPTQLGPATNQFDRVCVTPIM